ncbi:hypothetical protein LOAG_18325 [Loa loa]|uniref:Uncharacterized protein n=1 Tax=Loa loa TaxID=7209 RepID=A0A1S0UF96_LOALO|nr:hypothetical protein LOAG_18325 [Loa loa]EJD74352.1 hypothetical protein LOAG_18325 [Loa loa]
MMMMMMMWQSFQILFVTLTFIINDGQTNNAPDSGDPTNQGKHEKKKFEVKV